MIMDDSREARIHMAGWSGHWSEQIIVIGETPKRYRIQAIKRIVLPGRNRFLESGERALVPKNCITFESTADKDNAT